MVCSSGKTYTPTVKVNFTVGAKGERIIDGTLGVPVSHGCVRLATENVKFIYDNITAGTAIWSK